MFRNRGSAWLASRATPLLVLGSALACAPRPQPTTALRGRLERQLSSESSRGAVVVAVLDRVTGARIIVARGGATEHTVFEIGSITKAFTGTLLGDEVVRGRLGLDDPAQRYLAEVRLPTHPSGPIRLLHLSTFTSGLPFMPTNWVTVDEGVYTQAMWREFLQSYVLPSEPGTRFLYGNVGFGVLGDALAAREQTTLESLFHARIWGPLGMDHTWFLGSRPKDASVAQGYDDAGHPVPLDRDKPLQAGCCAIESSARDLLQFLDAGLTKSTLTAAFDLALAPRVPAALTGREDVGLGWFLPELGAFAEKDGLMKGYRSDVILDRKERLAIVVLAADAAFPSELVARRARKAVILERDLPPLPIVDSLPANLNAASAHWDTGLDLLGFTAPETARAGARMDVCSYLRPGRGLAADYRVFVHAKAPGAPRLRADHDPVRPTSDWPVGAIVRDCFTVDVPASQPKGPMTLWMGFFVRTRMGVLAGGDGHDRVKGPTVAIVP